MNLESDKLRIAYVLSGFPSVSETFAIDQIMATRELGIDISIFTVKSLVQEPIHPSALPLLPYVHRSPYLSMSVLSAQWYFLRRKPVLYLGTLAFVFKKNLTSLNSFVRSMALFPKAVLWAREAEALGIDHIQALWANYPTTMALIMSRLTGIPFSFMAHAWDLYAHPTLLKEKVEQAAFVIAITHYNRVFLQKVSQSTPVDRIHVIHPGADTKRFFLSGTRDRACDNLTLLYVGRFDPKKGIPYLIQALDLLLSWGLSFRCIIVGSGSEEKKVRHAITSLHLEDKVTLVGAITQDELPKYYAGADIFVLPSIVLSGGNQEGLPRVVMEAMASELPVVTTHVPGMDELVDDQLNGLLVPQADSVALAKAIARLFRDPTLRQSLGRNGRLKVLAKFDTGKNASRIASLIQESVSESCATATS